MAAHLDERVRWSGLSGGMKSWRVQVRAGSACNAHAMSREARDLIVSGFSFGALQQAFALSGVPGVTWAMRLQGQDAHRKCLSPMASAYISLHTLSRQKGMPTNWPTRGRTQVGCCVPALSLYGRYMLDAMQMGGGYGPGAAIRRREFACGRAVGHLAGTAMRAFDPVPLWASRNSEPHWRRATAAFAPR